jgi:stage II sporulation protein R
MMFQKVLLLCAAVLSLLLLTAAEIQADPALPPFIRIHVLANSDVPADQALKNTVRDRLIAAYGPKLARTDSLQAAQAYLRGRLDELERTALEAMAQAGFAYPVRAEYGTFDFPARSYGGQVYPAGRYEALRVVIGRGQGANWWCVMFPPLCFVDVSAAPSAASAQAEGVIPGAPRLKRSEAPDIVYTFKAAELWQRIRGFFRRK